MAAQGVKGYFGIFPKFSFPSGGHSMRSGRPNYAPTRDRALSLLLTSGHMACSAFGAISTLSGLAVGIANRILEHRRQDLAKDEKAVAVIVAPVYVNGVAVVMFGTVAVRAGSKNADAITVSAMIT